jgi:hypothetical protein
MRTYDDAAIEADSDYRSAGVVFALFLGSKEAVAE